MWQAPEPRAAPGVAVFGKTPRMGDFLRVGSAGRAGDSFDDWIQQGMAHAEAKRGAIWPAAYGSGALWAYIFRPPRAANVREGLVGVMKPSVDAVGRRFPLVVAAPALSQCEAPWPHVLPLAFGDFLEAAAATLFGSEQVAGPADMQAALARLPSPAPRDPEVAARDYDAWAASTPLVQAFSVIYRGDGLSVPRAIHTILEAIAPFRGQEAPNTKLSLRLPLGAGGVAAATFWIDTIRHMARSPAEVRTCFWSTEGDAGSIVLQLGNTPASSLGELWCPDANSEYTCDLTVPASVDVGRFLTALPPHLVEVLQSPVASVRDFLGRLMF